MILTITSRVSCGKKDRSKHLNGQGVIQQLPKSQKHGTGTFFKKVSTQPLVNNVKLSYDDLMTISDISLEEDLKATKFDDDLNEMLNDSFGWNKMSQISAETYCKIAIHPCLRFIDLSNPVDDLMDLLGKDKIKSLNSNFDQDTLKFTRVGYLNAYIYNDADRDCKFVLKQYDKTVFRQFKNEMLVLDKLNPSSCQMEDPDSCYHTCFYDNNHFYVILNDKHALSTLSDPAISNKIRAMSSEDRKQVYIELAQMVKNMHNESISSVCLAPNTVMVSENLTDFKILNLQHTVNTETRNAVKFKINFCHFLVPHWPSKDDSNEPVKEIVSMDIVNLAQIFIFLDPNVLYAFKQMPNLDLLTLNSSTLYSFWEHIYKQGYETIDNLVDLVSLAYWGLARPKPQARREQASCFSCLPYFSEENKEKRRYKQNPLRKIYTKMLLGTHKTIAEVLIQLETLNAKDFEGVILSLDEEDPFSDYKHAEDTSTLYMSAVKDDNRFANISTKHLDQSHIKLI